MRSERGIGVPHEEPTFSDQKSLGREFQDVELSASNIFIAFQKETRNSNPLYKNKENEEGQESNLSQTLEYLAHCSEQEFKNLLTEIKKSPIPEQLDLLHLLQSAGAVEASKAGGVAIQERIVQLLMHFEEKDYPYPIVKLAAELAHGQIVSAELKSRPGKNLFAGSKTGERVGRLNAPSDDRELTFAEQTLQSALLKQKVKFDYAIKPGQLLLPVSGDAVTMMDASGLPFALGSADSNLIKDVRESYNKRKMPKGETINKSILHFVNYDKLGTQKDLFPFGLSPGEARDIPLLLQHLHRPDMLAYLKNNLKISVTELPLRSQIHLLRYLSGQEKQTFDRLASILQANPENSNNILNSFLACAEDEQNGQAVLNIAEKADVALRKKIFEKYNEVISLGEDVKNNLTDYFGLQSGIIDITLVSR